MKNIVSATYNSGGGINVVLDDGTTATVPDWPEGWPDEPVLPVNMDTVEVYEWVEKSGGEIRAYEPPPPPPEPPSMQDLMARIAALEAKYAK